MKNNNNNHAVATFGGGCFWCTEAIFQEVEGVLEVTSGYSGGEDQQPTYEAVCTGLTGHAEVIEIVYDPSVIAFEEILVIFLTTHNPTQLNAQGADRGTQYRSIIFHRSDLEKKIAEFVIAELQPYFDTPIVTEIKEFDAFYPAEERHQNYYRDHSEFRYCTAVIEPKLAAFRKNYGDKLKAKETP